MISARIAILLLLFSSTSCQGPHAVPQAVSSVPQEVAIQPIEAPGLHNVVAFTPGIWSGSAPEGDAGFESLHEWGVRTIISVDGAIPEIDCAQKWQLRYLHLPIGYDGFDEERKLEIARAVRDLPGPIYIHCHHGKHRSAAAAASAAVSLGKLTPDQAIARMHVSGTSPQYPGLYACAASGKVVATELIDGARSDFPSITRPGTLVEAMVSIDESNDRLALVKAASWCAPADHPDLVPAAVAGAIADHFRDLAAMHEPKFGADADMGPGTFLGLLSASQRHAQRIEDLLTAAGTLNRTLLDAEFHELQTDCKACHQSHRDRRRTSSAAKLSLEEESPVRSPSRVPDEKAR